MVDPRDFGSQHHENTGNQLTHSEEKNCVWKGFGNWIVEAAANDHWMLTKPGIFSLGRYFDKILVLASTLKSLLSIRVALK